MDSAVAKLVAEHERDRPRTIAYQPLVLVLAFACAGIIIERHVAVPWLAWIGAAASAIVVWLALLLRGRERLASVTLLMAVAAVGGAWHGLAWRWFDADELGRFATQRSRPVCVEAVARELPRHFPP